MNPRWNLRTARLVLTPVSGADLPDLIAIKADPRVFAVMLGGVLIAVRAGSRAPGTPGASSGRRAAVAEPAAD